MIISAPRERKPAGAGDRRPIRVGMLVGSVGERGGGVPASARSMAQALSREPDISVTVFASDDTDSAPDDAAWRPAALNVFPVLGPSTFGYARGLDRALERAEIDVLHVHGLWMYISIAARRWAARTGRPYVVSPHGMLDHWALANSGWKKAIALRAYERRHLDGASCVHALCGQERQAVRDFGLHNPVCVIPNGVDLPPSRAPSFRPARKRPRRTLLYLGRLTPKKGLVQLIEAWAKVRTEPGARDWDLEIAGMGEPSFVAGLNALIESCGVAQSVRLIGHQAGEAKARTFVSADAFILPSVSEGQPLAVLEAWGHGLPALITPQCNLLEGFVAQAAIPIGWRAEEVATGLSALFGMPAADLAEMGRRGRQLVEHQFSWTTAAARWAEIYRWASGASTAPHSVSSA